MPLCEAPDGEAARSTLLLSRSNRDSFGGYRYSYSCTVGALPVDNKNHLLNNHPLLPVTPTGTGTRYNYCIPVAVAVAVGRGGVGVGVGVEGVTTTAIITKTTNDVTKRKDQMRVRPPAAHCELACLGSELFFESVMFG